MEDRLEDVGQHGGHDDPDEDGPAHAADHEDRGEQQAHDEHEHGPAGQLPARAQAHRHGGPRRVRQSTHESGVDQADQGDEQADADDDPRLEPVRHGVEHGRPEAGGHEEDHHEAREHHEAHDVRPGQARRGGHGDGDERVHAQSGGQGEGVPGPQAHRDRGHRGHERRGGGDARDPQGGARRVRAREDQRVEHHDVAHGQEGGDAAAHLLAGGRAALRDGEVPVEPGAGGGRADVLGGGPRCGGPCGAGRHGHQPSEGGAPCAVRVGVRQTRPG